MKRTLLYTVLLFAVIVGLGEGLARTDSVQRVLPEPSFGTAYLPAIRLFQELDEFGKVDCLFFGNSMVNNGFNPQVFEQAYQAAAGESIRCFTFGVPGLTASSAGPMAEILVERYHPDLLIYGIEGVELGGFVSVPGEDGFPRTDWVRYARGQLNLEGWLLDHSFLYRYLDTAPEILTPAAVENRLSTDARSIQGYAPLLEFAKPYRTSLFATEPLVFNDYSLSAADFEGFKQIVNLKGTRVFIVNLPSYIGQVYRQEHQQPYPVIETAAAYAHSHGIPFWRTPDFFSVADWADLYHLYATGAEQYSRWFAAQFAEAVRRGLFEPDAPPELLSNPPLQNLTLEPLAHDGFSDADWQMLQDYESPLVPPGAVIFDPSNTPLTVPFLRQSIGLYLNWHQNPPEKTPWFDFLTVLDQVQGGDFAAWRASKDPADLDGVDYLFYSDLWMRWLTDAEIQVLQNPLNYELIASWSHPSMPVTYFLYRVVKGMSVNLPNSFVTNFTICDAESCV